MANIDESCDQEIDVGFSERKVSVARDIQVSAKVEFLNDIETESTYWSPFQEWIVVARPLFGNLRL